MKLLSHVWLFPIPWTVDYQGPPSMEFSRQEYWSGVPFPSPGDLSDPGIEPRSPALQADALPSEAPGKPSKGSQPWILIGRIGAEAPIHWLPDGESWLTGKDLDAGKDWGQEKGSTENKMVGWHYWLTGHEFEQILGDSEGQGSLACCSPRRIRHNLATEQQQSVFLPGKSCR